MSHEVMDAAARVQKKRLIFSVILLPEYEML